METILCTPQPSYVIVEQIHLKTGLPSIGNTVGPTLHQVFRRVLQVCDVQDMFFDGRRISGMPTPWQYLQEFVRPGNQITTRPTGERQFTLVYGGFINVLQPLPQMGNLLPESWTRSYNLGTPPTPFIYGTDPIPNVRLYGNPRVQFIMPGGEPPPTAMAIYNTSNRRLDLPPLGERERVLQQLVQRQPARPVR